MSAGCTFYGMLRLCSQMQGVKHHVYFDPIDEKQSTYSISTRCTVCTYLQGVRPSAAHFLLTSYFSLLAKLCAVDRRKTCYSFFWNLRVLSSYPEVISLKHESRILRHCCPICGHCLSYCSVLKYWLENEKYDMRNPYTSQQQCPRILFSSFKARTSAPSYLWPRGRVHATLPTHSICV